MEIVSIQLQDNVLNTPLLSSTIYLDIPVAPESVTKRIEVVQFDDKQLTDDYTVPADYIVAIYPLKPEDVYGSNNKVFTLEDSVIDKNAGEGPPVPPDPPSTKWYINYINDDFIFAEDSPTKRLFFIGSPVSYCVQSGLLTRFSGYSANMYDSDNMVNKTIHPGVLMAEGVNTENTENTENGFPFSVSAPTLQRNATILINITFERNQELITFSNEVQIPNVP